MSRVFEHGDRVRRYAFGSGVCLAIVLACATGQALAQVQSATEFQQATTLFNEHHWQQALAAFKKIEKQAPGQTDALLFIGKCLINVDRIPEADSALSQYIKAHPRSDDAISLLGFCRFRENKPRDSLKLYTRAAAIRTPEATDFKIVGLDYALLHDYDDATICFRIALKLRPDDIEAWYNLGRSEFQLQRYDNAMAAFKQVLREDPRNVKGENNLGLCYEAKSQMKQAAAAFRLAIQLQRNAPHPSAQPYLNLGTLLTMMGRPEQALPSLQKAKQLDPRLAETCYQLGKAYLMLRKLKQSAAQLQEAIRLRPHYTSAHYQLGTVYRLMGKEELAKVQFQKASTLFSKKH